MPNLLINQPAGPVQGPRASAAEFGGQEAAATRQLGRQVQQAGEIPAAWSAMKARRSAAEYRVALQDTARQMSLTQDLEGAEERFQTERRRLQDRFRKGSRGIYDAQASVTGDQIESQFRHSIRMRQIEDGQNDLDEVLRLHADELATSEAPDDRAMALVRGTLAIDEARESGLIGDADVDKLTREFSTRAMGGVLRRFQNDDPAAGIEFLDSGEFVGSEEERQVWRGHMMVAMRTRVNAELSEARRQEAYDRKAQKLRADSAQKALIEKAFGNGFTEQDVLDFADVWTPTEMESLLATARSGGKFVATQSDPQVWDELRVLATIDDPNMDDAPFEEQARRAFFRGQITKGDYGSLLSLYEDTRIGEFTEMIHSDIAGHFLVGPGDKAKSREAQRAFTEWYVRRSEELGDAPSLDESYEFARRQVESAMLSRADDPIYQMAPSSLVGTVTKPDIQATAQAIIERVQSGEIDPVEASIETRRLRRLEESVNAKGARQAAQNEGGE